MKTPFALLLVSVLACYTDSRSQTSRPVSRISESGVLETLGLEVNFNCPVFNPEKGVQYVTVDDVSEQYPDVTTLFEDIAGTYGEFQLIKEVPEDIWGDTLKPRVSDGVLVRVFDMSQFYYLQFSEYIPVDEVIAQVVKLSEVEFAHPPAEAVSLTDTPNDPRYLDGSQWNLENILAERAWDISHGSGDITVAIIESDDLPYDQHPDLQNKWDPDRGEQGTGYGEHGARVAGIIGAATNNNTGIASLGWNLKMSRYAFSYGEPPTTLVQKINDAVSQGNRIVNCSFVTIRLVGLNASKSCTFRVFENYAGVELAIRNAIQQGVIVVAGTGNSWYWHLLYGPATCMDHIEEVMGFPGIAFPSAYPGVIGVSATGEQDLWAEGQDLSDMFQWYNNGTFVDVAAPGMYVLTTVPPNTYSSTDRGTSFSTPHVSALAGLILSVNDSLSPAQINDIITSTADKVDFSRFPYSNGRNDYLGYGRINAYKALSVANGAPASPQNVTSGYTPCPSVQHPVISWSANSEPDLSGYNVYKSYDGGQQWVKQNTSFITGSSWTDPTEGIDCQVHQGYPVWRYYHVTAVDAASMESSPSAEVSALVDGQAPIEKRGGSAAEKPTTYTLHTAYPNPFNPSTQIKYDLPEAGFVSLVVYDVLGRQVSELVKDYREAGYHTVTWNSPNEATGVYYARITVINSFGTLKYSKMNKLLLVK